MQIMKFCDRTKSFKCSRNNHERFVYLSTNPEWEWKHNFNYFFAASFLRCNVTTIEGIKCVSWVVSHRQHTLEREMKLNAQLTIENEKWLRVRAQEFWFNFGLFWWFSWFFVLGCSAMISCGFDSNATCELARISRPQKANILTLAP